MTEPSTNPTPENTTQETDWYSVFDEPSKEDPYNYIPLGKGRALINPEKFIVQTNASPGGITLDKGYVRRRATIKLTGHALVEGEKAPLTIVMMRKNKPQFAIVRGKLRLTHSPGDTVAKIKMHKLKRDSKERIALQDWLDQIVRASDLTATAPWTDMDLPETIAAPLREYLKLRDPEKRDPRLESRVAQSVRKEFASMALAPDQPFLEFEIPKQFYKMAIAIMRDLPDWIEEEKARVKSKKGRKNTA